MKISMTDAGKRFSREWVFRHVHHHFESGKSYAITGANGSGKSTLLQVIAGAYHPSEGSVTYQNGGKVIDTSDQYRHVSVCAPYMELVEEMTGQEFLDFHGRFKRFRGKLNSIDILGEMGLGDASGKQIRYYSSGMRQRLKLAQSILSDTPVLLLDEPCTNLDRAGIELYLRLIEDHGGDRIVVVCSNDPVEYQFCQEAISMHELGSKGFDF